MKKMFLVFSIIFFCLFITGAWEVSAQEQVSSNIEEDENAGLNIEEEEMDLESKPYEQQIQAQKQENSQEMKQDMQTVKKELSNDTKETEQEGYLPSNKDQDNNPLGPQGAPGANPDRKPKK
ncbi:MAG: hypothetical protein WC571_02605 [Candidatus Omnitrophota bacterium]